MKYDRKYGFTADAVEEFEVYGKWWSRKNKKSYCAVCDELTRWIDLDFQCYICSEECDHHLTFDYFFQSSISGILSYIRVLREKITNWENLDDDLEIAREYLSSLEVSILDVKENVPRWMAKLREY